jgi:hypothetical protein
MSSSAPYTAGSQLLILAALALTALVGGGCGGSESTSDRTTPTTVAPGRTSESNENTEAAVSTELDLGQAFAEDPRFEGELGPASILITTDRTNPQQPEIDIQLARPGSTPLNDVTFTLRFDVLEGELTPAPDQDLVLSVDQTQGDCAELEETASASALRCNLGVIEPVGEVQIHIVVSGTFKLRTTMGLTFR